MAEVVVRFPQARQVIKDQRGIIAGGGKGVRSAQNSRNVQSLGSKIAHRRAWVIDDRVCALAGSVKILLQIGDQALELIEAE